MKYDEKLDANFLAMISDYEFARTKQKQDMFGFIDGETVCSDCGQVLTRDDCFWGMGCWWHNKKESCENFKKGNEALC